MGAQHTPGPWEFRCYAAGCCVVSSEYVGNVRRRLTGVHVMVDAMVNDDQSNAHEASADARLIAAAPDLLDALTDLEVLYLRDGEGWNECFERVAELFHKDTGYLRPGKDSAAAAGDDREARDKVWEAWIASRRDRARAAIAKATGTAS